MQKTYRFTLQDHEMKETKRQLISAFRQEMSEGWFRDAFALCLYVTGLQSISQLPR